MRSRCRRCRIAARCACAPGRPCRGGRRASWPTGSARTAPRRPRARGTSRRCEGPASRCPERPVLPVFESQTIVDARWLAMPTASTGPPSASAAVATSSAAAPISAASNSTKPGDGERGSTSRWWTWSTVASGRTIAARTPLVPTSTTRMLTLWAPPRAAGVPRSSRPPCLRPSRAARSTRCRDHDTSSLVANRRSTPTPWTSSEGDDRGHDAVHQGRVELLSSGRDGRAHDQPGEHDDREERDEGGRVVAG